MFEEEDNSNRLAEVCQRCLSTTILKDIRKGRLFITQQKSTTREENQQIRIRESHHIKMHKCHQNKSRLQQANQINHKSVNNLISSKSMTISAILLCLAIISIWPQSARGQQSSEIRAANLPTVIVRGFLNYRTTVDGTVLLFTPDAGGSSSAGSQAPATSAFVAPTATISVAISSSRTVQEDQQIEPTSSFQAPTATLAPFEMAQDPWRPIQSTPPLRPMQTITFNKPNQFQQIAGTSASPMEQPTEGPSFSVVLSQPEVTSQRSQAAAARPQESSSTPSVQADDIILSSNEQQQAATTTMRASTTERTSRPKRPSLGFNGQNIRAGGLRSDRPRPQTGNQNEAQTFNTINGIRRPGISTTPSPFSAESEPPVAPSRSSVAGAKLRNRFKKPPTSGASSTTQAPTTTPAAITSNVTFLQSAESGEEPVIGAIMSSPPVATLEVVADSPIAESAPTVSEKPSSGSQVSQDGLESRLGDQAALQARLGDLFGPQQPQTSTGASNAPAPVVGSDEVLSMSAPDATGSSSAQDSGLDPRKLVSRSGDQPPSPDMQHESHLLGGGLSGELQQGQLGNAPLSFDAFFQGDQPQQSESSEHRAHHQAKESAISTSGTGSSGKKNHNDRLTGWLDHHHSNKHIPRPAKHQHGDQHEAGHLSQQLAANLNSLAPSFSSNLPNSLKPTPVQQTPHQTEHPSLKADQHDQLNHNTTTANVTTTEQPEVLPMQTLTRTYSTVMTSTRTRLVPLQVKSSTAVHTITENYIITKMLTAYQTMPVGEFILPEPQNTRSPFEMFETPVAPAEDKSREQPIVAPSNFAAAPVVQPETQEQPISFEASQKSPNDWLHDFSNLNNNNINNNQQQNHLAALLEQQAAQENSLAAFGSLGEPLDQLASSLDPSALLDGQIQIPDLNNPVVLAAAIQNPQLAAVILAAQQLKLKQQQQAAGNKLLGANLAANPQQPAQQLLPAALQPSYSTIFSTQVRPSTYTVRDTMFTTRLVSFKDGRTVRTRTVSEPGSVIEQVLTTTVTETTPVTLTIRPTGLLTLPGPGQLATAPPSSTNQATISNALIATQLANLLSRRQQQVQPSGLAALQQLLAGQQQQQQQRANNQQQLAKQFQPNFQNLLQSLQQQQQLANPSPLTSSPTPPVQQQQQQQASQNRPSLANPQQQAAADQPQPTPPLMPIPTQPFVTTITNLQVKTYTVHNAFKTIFRTITSTQLVTSTIFPAGMTRNPSLMG